MENIENNKDIELKENENLQDEEVNQESENAQDEDISKEQEESLIDKMSDEELQGAVEAILFSMGESVSLKDVAKSLNADIKRLEKALLDLEKTYESSNRGIKIVKLEDSYQLCTKNEYYDLLIKLVNMPKKHSLTDTLLETLSIIAYKQPITRQEIEAIRGVSCVHAINKLVEYKLIEEVGRLDAVGRPILFGTTEDFLRSFGVSSMDDLPVITPDKIEDFKKEAMEEVNIKVET